MAKIETFADELPYAYYNVAGHDKIVLHRGVRDLVAKAANGGFAIGIGTNCLAEITKIKFDRAGLGLGSFRFQEYGGALRRSSDVINAALADVEEQGIDRSYAVVVSASQSIIDGAGSLGVRTIGVTANGVLTGATLTVPDFRNIVGVAVKM